MCANGERVQRKGCHSARIQSLVTEERCAVKELHVARGVVVLLVTVAVSVTLLA